MQLENESEQHQQGLEVETPAKKSKLAVIRATLQTNPDVYYAGEVVKLRGFHKVAASSTVDQGRESVTIYFAPIVPIFDPDTLNTFFRSIINQTGVEFQGSKSHAFNNYLSARGPELVYGQYTGYEDIGLRSTTVTETITDPDTRAKLGVVDGARTYDMSEKLTRVLTLKALPDAITAKHLHAYMLGRANYIVERDESYDDLETSIGPEQIKALQKWYQENPDWHQTNPNFDTRLLH